MNKFKLLLCSLFFTSYVLSQKVQSLSHVEVDTSKNIEVRKLHTDSLSSSFYISIKEGVRPHKHIEHSESIYVLKGEGEMKIGSKTITIKQGDFFNIPMNTVHSLRVTSSTPVEVISFQTPEFLGKDRVFID